MKKRESFFFFLGALIFGIIGVAAATVFAGSDISYDKNKTNLNSDNVQDVIDEMYDKVIYGDANSNSILSGKKALVNGNKYTGCNAYNNCAVNTYSLNSNIFMTLKKYDNIFFLVITSFFD